MENTKIQPYQKLKPLSKIFNFKGRNYKLDDETFKKLAEAREKFGYNANFEGVIEDAKTAFSLHSDIICIIHKIEDNIKENIVNKKPIRYKRIYDSPFQWLKIKLYSDYDKYEIMQFQTDIEYNNKKQSIMNSMQKTLIPINDIIEFNGKKYKMDKYYYDKNVEIKTKYGVDINENKVEDSEIAYEINSEIISNEKAVKQLIIKDLKAGIPVRYKEIKD